MTCLWYAFLLDSLFIHFFFDVLFFLSQDKNVVIEVVEQYTEYQRLADTYKASLETCQGLLKDAEDELAPLKDEVETLRERATLLEETEENVKALTKAVEAANTERCFGCLC